MTGRSIEIYTNVVETDDEMDADFLAERGLDLVVPEDTNFGEVLRLLFEGFEDRLKAAGINATIGNFDT